MYVCLLFFDPACSTVLYFPIWATLCAHRKIAAETVYNSGLDAAAFEVLPTPQNAVAHHESNVVGIAPALNLKILQIISVGARAAERVTGANSEKLARDG